VSKNEEGVDAEVHYKIGRASCFTLLWIMYWHLCIRFTISFMLA